MDSDDALVPPRLQPGDRVRLVSPASFPTVAGIEEARQILSSWGLRVEAGEHALDQFGFMAGTDVDRLADLNDALRDPGVRAVVTTRGGAGAYRIVDGIDFEAARRDPKPVVGFSDITNIHLALWQHSRVVGLHGMVFGVTGEATRRALMTTEPIVLHRDPAARSAAVAVDGVASGFLIGGNLGAIAGQVGAGMPSLDGGILFFESLAGDVASLDQVLFQLTASGALDGVRGIVIGHLTPISGAVEDSPPAEIVELLQERLGRLGVPILGGLPLGHDPDPLVVPLGTTAFVDTAAGTLTVAPGVR
ncbi:S66 peptidase family protein [Kribbella sp. CA-293567]|uniref:S66 peptidase family protein n=1 Tax=Kribbella sp. CA-293567 TaxID=3002436 RepID=UPI0022DD651B|nr:LD-carboxypeptidase [Kribbella sp. CA-293567]WBQ02165.1 LD-carboxypeptidase [Kribbella sp. CA-293567]